MRVYLDPPNVKSPSIHRVAHALKQYAPADVEVVPFKEVADLVILHVIGRQEHIQRSADVALAHGQKYTVIQYCLRSTMQPKVDGWIPLWKNAVVVWSYYALPEICYQDNVLPEFQFYHAPLGVDPVFTFRERAARPFLICTSGQGYLSESVRECIKAAQRVGGTVFHLGPSLGKRAPEVVCKQGMTDAELAEMYRQCQFVSGLRRTEGFELPAAEGLLCGARPILFDQPHYRQWYDGWAEYIHEGDRAEVEESLVHVFTAGARPVAWDEQETAKARFDWPSIIRGFWERCR